jgi:hypothetical protein
VGEDRALVQIADPASMATADRISRQVGDLLRGQELDLVFTVLINQFAGLVVANGIALERAIEAFKEAHGVYRRKADGLLWTPR